MCHYGFKELLWLCFNVVGQKGDITAMVSLKLENKRCDMESFKIYVQ